MFKFVVPRIVKGWCNTKCSSPIFRMCISTECLFFRCAYLLFFLCLQTLLDEEAMTDEKKMIIEYIKQLKHENNTIFELKQKLKEQEQKRKKEADRRLFEQIVELGQTYEGRTPNQEIFLLRNEVKRLQATFDRTNSKQKHQEDALEKLKESIQM